MMYQTDCSTGSSTVPGVQHGGGAGVVTGLAANVQHFGPSSGGNRRRERWLQQITDEVAHIAAKGGTGTMTGLLRHLQLRFGSVTQEDLNLALDPLPDHCLRNFK